jgi:hypothetical protein
MAQKHKKYMNNESVEDLDEASVAGKYAVQIRHKITGKVDSKEYDAKNKSHAIKQAEAEHHSSRYDVNKSPTLVKESEDLDESGLDEASAIVTKQNTDGTYDEVGTNNRGIMRGSLSKIKSQAKDRFGKNHRIELFHGDRVDGNPHTTLHIKESEDLDEAIHGGPKPKHAFDTYSHNLKVAGPHDNNDLGPGHTVTEYKYTGKGMGWK